MALSSLPAWLQWLKYLSLFRYAVEVRMIQGLFEVFLEGGGSIVPNWKRFFPLKTITTFIVTFATNLSGISCKLGAT